jgi:uncharacterized metal-binding protein YceD (DUF177 family)
MRNPLLDRSTPRELAERGQVIEKQQELQVFAHLTEVVAADLSSLDEDEVPGKWRQAPVEIRLVFGWGDSRQQIPVANGRVRARIPAVCQRCLGLLELTLDVELRLLFTGPDRVTGAADDYEVWELEEATLRPLDILEEALIMAMPLSALHGPGEACESPTEASVADSADAVRPFADLRSQMRQKD